MFQGVGPTRLNGLAKWSVQYSSAVLRMLVPVFIFFSLAAASLTYSHGKAIKKREREVQSKLSKLRQMEGVQITEVDTAVRDPAL